MKIKKRKVSCTKGDLVLRGTEYLPADVSEGASLSLPAAIISHGFMANRNSVRHYAKALAHLGFAAFCFDFSGGCALGGKSDGKTTEMSVLTEVDDLGAIVDYVLSLPQVAHDGVFLMGCSQGGLVSALYASKHSDVVNGLALFYPALCIPDDARAGKMMFARLDPHNVPASFWCGPMKLGRRYATDVMTMDPFAIIGSYSGPVLIVQGTADAIVDPSYARRAWEVYDHRGFPNSFAELIFIEGAGHGFTPKYDRQATAGLLCFAEGVKPIVGDRF